MSRPPPSDFVDPDEEDADAIVDLDGGTKGGSAKIPKEKTPKTSSGGGEPGVFGLTFRGGYSKYYGFNFLTFGGEGAIPAGPVHVVVGLEVYAVNRQVPEDLWANIGKVSEWNTIFPFNVGVVYKLDDLSGSVVPYFGGDIITVNYYESSWAAGVRARAGVDLMVSSQFGFNVNLSAGMWSGSRWGEVEPDIGNSGVLPQISAGTVVTF